MNINNFQKDLCRQLCRNIQLIKRDNGILMLEAPFTYPDGDHFSLYVKEIENNKIRISDEANTIMRLSYNTPNVEKYFQGHRGKIMEQIKQEFQLQEDDGNFYLETPISAASEGLFRLTQALNQIYNLSYLDQNRASSTFYADMKALLQEIITPYKFTMESKYQVPNLPNKENYVIDYSLRNGAAPFLFLFGVPNEDKAKLATITLQYLFIKKIRTPALLIFENQEELSPRHLSRLMDSNIGGSQVSSLSSKDAIQNNIYSYSRAA